MKKRVSLVLILSVCILWSAIPVLAGEVSGTVETDTVFVKACDVVTVGPEHEVPFELSQEVKDWWDDIHHRRAEVEAGTDRPKVGYDDPGTFPPPTTEEFLVDKEALQPNSTADFQIVIGHSFTTAENPNVTNDSNPSVGFSQMKKGFMVYKQGAARSQDHGNSWTFVNPLIGSPGGSWFFTGKQEVIFDPLYNIHLWVQLYGYSSGGGLIRVGASRDTTEWHFWTLTSNSTILPDDPHIRLGHDFFYVTWDQYSNGGSTWNRSRIYRIDLARVMRYTGLYVRSTYNENYRNFLVAKNVRNNSIMYAVSNGYAVGNLGIMEWPEWSINYTVHSISVNNWGYSPSSFNCTCPDGNNPCEVAPNNYYEDRVRAAVAAYGDSYPESGKRQMWVGFNSAIYGSYTKPFIYLVKINMDTWQVLGYHHLYSSSYALHNLDMVPNPAGDIGMVAELLGGTQYTYLVMTILDNDIQDFSAPFSWFGIANGSPCPSGAYFWGHKNTVNLWWRNQFQFTAIGHYMSSSGPVHRYVRFTNEKYFP